MVPQRMLGPLRWKVAVASHLLVMASNQVAKDWRVSQLSSTLRPFVVMHHGIGVNTFK